LPAFARFWCSASSGEVSPQRADDSLRAEAEDFVA
jgi:hypothetical protein